MFIYICDEFSQVDGLTSNLSFYTCIFIYLRVEFPQVDGLTSKGAKLAAELEETYLSLYLSSYIYIYIWFSHVNSIYILFSSSSL